LCRLFAKSRGNAIVVLLKIVSAGLLVPLLVAVVVVPPAVLLVPLLVVVVVVLDRRYLASISGLVVVAELAVIRACFCGHRDSDFLPGFSCSLLFWLSMSGVSGSSLKTVHLQAF
jgi:hypothetical protein